MNVRLQKIQKQLPIWGVDVLIVTNPQDLFYITGQQLSRGMLLVFEQQELLIVDGRYFEGCKQRCPFTVLLEQPTVVENALKSLLRIGFYE